MNERALVCMLLAAGLVINAVSLSARASQPCPVSYSVTYSSPLWTVRILAGTPEYPLRELSFRLSGRWTDEPVEEVVNHSGRLPTPTELVTYQDRDGDSNISEGDDFMVWEENATLRTDNSRAIFLYWDRDWRSGNFSFSWSIFVQEGHQVTCESSPPTLDFTLLVTGALAILAFSILIVLIARQRRPR